MEKKKSVKKSSSIPTSDKPSSDSISAQSIAEAMAANMAANQADPNWEIEQEQMRSESAARAFKKHAKELKDAGITIPNKKDSKLDSKDSK